MKNSSRIVGIGIAALLLGLLGGGGYAWYQAYQRTPINCVTASDNAHAAGLVAFCQGNDAVATLRFHEAQLHAEEALGLLEQARVDPLPRAPERLAIDLRLEGQAHWCKFKALRGRSVAKVRGEGKPLLPLDGVAADQGEAYLARLYATRLPEESLRAEALASLRLAALRLPEQEVLQREAVQQELQFEPKHWPLAETLAAQLVRLQPNDPAARYLLARFEFEQPVVTNGTLSKGALGAEKRSLERTKKALEHLAVVKAGENPPRWRTTYLEAQILCWQAQYFREPSHRKPEREQEALIALNSLLLDEPHGVLPRAARVESSFPLSRLDTEGLLGLHALAVELAVQQNRQPTGDAPANVATRLTQFVAMARQLQSQQATPLQKSLCFQYLVQVGRLAQPFLPGTHETWQALLKLGGSGCGDVLAGTEGDLGTLHRWAELLGREATRAPNPAAAQALREQALACVESCLKLGQQRKLSAEHLIVLHDLAARFKGQQGARREELLPHLTALQQSKQPPLQAMGFLMEAALLEQEGRLEQARDLFLRAAAVDQGTEAGRRAQVALAPLHLTLGQPAAALQCLAEVEKQLSRGQSLAADEKAWLQRFLKGPQDLALLKLRAHLAAARLAYQQLNSGGEAAVATMREQEQAAVELLGRFAEGDSARRAAREALVRHLLATQRLDQAGEHLAGLRRDHPDSVTALRLENELLRRRAATPDLADVIAARIQQFHKRFPENTAAKLYWAEWLLSQGRAAEAVAYLDDPAHFLETARDQEWLGMRELARQSSGDLTSSITQASGLATTLSPIATADYRPTVPKDHPGMQTCRKAQQASQRGDWAEAARIYLAALDFTALRPQVRVHLQAVLLDQASKNPAEVKALLIDMMQQKPEEPVLLAAFAECCFLLGEFGGPVAKLTQVNDLQTALVAYDLVTRRDDPVGARASLLRASFLRRLNRPDLARAEVARLLGRAPDHAEALAVALELAIDAEVPEVRKEALPLGQRLRSLLPESPLPYLLQAQLLSATGDMNGAASTLAECRKRFPTCGPAFAGQVKLAFQTGDLGAATQVVTEWRTALPHDLLAAQAAIRCLAAQGQMDQARALHEQIRDACREPNERSQVTVLLAQALVDAKVLGEAQIWLTKLLTQQPDCEPALLLLGNLCMLQYRQTTGEAQRQAAAQAQAAFARVYQQRKGHLVAGNNLAWLLTVAGGDAEEALRLLREVRANRWTGQPLPAEMLPASVLDTFGLAFAGARAPTATTEARDLFLAARRRYPQDPRFCLYLGRAYAAAGLKPEAQQQYAAALSLAEQPPGLAMLANPARFKEDVQAARKTLE